MFPKQHSTEASCLVTCQERVRYDVTMQTVWPQKLEGLLEEEVIKVVLAHRSFVVYLQVSLLFLGEKFAKDVWWVADDGVEAAPSTALGTFGRPEDVAEAVGFRVPVEWVESAEFFWGKLLLLGDVRGDEGVAAADVECEFREQVLFLWQVAFAFECFEVEVHHSDFYRLRVEVNAEEVVVEDAGLAVDGEAMSPRREPGGSVPSGMSSG